MIRWCVVLMLAVTCHVSGLRKVAIDVGSSAVNVKIADVENYRVVKSIFEKDYGLPIGADIQHSGDNYFPDQTQYRLIEILNEVVEKAHELDATHYAAVATGAVAKARNTPSAMERIEKDTGIRIDPIDPELEAYLAFHAAVSETTLPADRVVVWDLGGGTQSFSTKIRGKLDTYISDQGAVAFMAEVIRKVKKENATIVETANPLSKKQVDAALALGRKLADPIPSSIRSKLKSRGVIVVGIGGLAFLIPDEKSSVTRQQLSDHLETLVGKNNRDLGGGPFVGARVTNVILALSMMDELGLNQMNAYDIDLDDALLLAKKAEELPSHTKKS